MARFGEGGVKYSAFFGVKKEGANFGFSGEGHDVAETLAILRMTPVVGWAFWLGELSR
jgi:hypothetical protein